MRPWLALFGAGGTAVVAFVFGSACSLNSDGGGGGGSKDGGTDAVFTSDTGPADAGPESGDGSSDDGACVGYTCNGTCVNSCLGCSAGEAICPTTRACGHCGAACAGSELECFACPSGGTPESYCGPPAGKCAAMGSTQPCPCAGGTPACPGAMQSCFVNSCLTCGEDGTDQQLCKNGLHCSSMTGVPACQ